MSVMTPLLSRLTRALLPLRRRLVPDERGLGWMPLSTLGYLLFLLVPALFANIGNGATLRATAGFWIATGMSIAAFLPLYFASFRSRGPAKLACIAGIAALAHVLMPLNPFSNTYTIYVMALLPFADLRLGARLLLALGVLLLFGLQVIALGYPVFTIAITWLVGAAVFGANHQFEKNLRKQAELRLSHDEVRRLAAMAERERIGRDLHDLLGHTLSLVALKSELAGKLIDRDPLAARREIDDVAKVSRDALSQVRRAVSGIRAAGLAAELASARLLLDSDGVTFTYQLADLRLSPELETVMALAVRESITNIQRHARARHASVRLDEHQGCARLSIIDDGRGGDIVPGNGLDGMRERIELLQGSRRVESARGNGTRVEILVPLPDRNDAAISHARVPHPRP